MTIKFPCPHCKKMLSVKEHLAGKKAACPACKQPITIPVPAAAPAVAEPDLEELAAAAFADAPAPAPKEAAAPEFIDFTCFYCDEQVKISAELGGKQAPCPACKRIVKVPQRVKEGPKDWRKVDTRTPLVAQRNEPAPEGAWGSTVATGNVSRQSLEDAAALPPEEETSPIRRWLFRGTLLTAVLLLAAGGWWGLSGWMRSRLEVQLIAKVDSFLKEPGSIAPESAAELERAVGEVHLLMHKAEVALQRFSSARAGLTRTEELNSRERDFLLADLAVHQVDLGGTKQQADDGVRVPWEKALREVTQTLVKIRHPEIRVEAVREVSRRLIARGEGGHAPSVAAQAGGADEVPELIAVVGLELLAAKMTQEANATAELAIHRYLEPLSVESSEPGDPLLATPESPEKPREPAKPRKPTLSAALIALWVGLDRRDEKANFPPPPPTAAGSAPLIVVGYAQGLGYRGERERARSLIKITTTAGKVEALAALAAAEVAAGQLEAARADVEEALALLEKEVSFKQVAPPVLFRLVRVGTQCGLTDALKPTATALADKDMKGRAQLAILRARLTAANTRLDESALHDVVDRETAAYALALEALARHNARVEGPRTARTAVDGWETSKQPFGWIGVALGSRDLQR